MEPVPRAEVVEAETEAEAEAEAEEADRWGVAWRRATWSLGDATVDGDEVSLHGVRFELATGADRGVRSDTARGSSQVVVEPGAEIDAFVASVDATRFATIQTRYRGGKPVIELVLRDEAGAIRSRIELARDPSRGRADARWDEGELVVVVPESCRGGTCTPTRLERWPAGDPDARRTLASRFDDALLDATGRSALVRTRAHRSVRVVDTRDASTRWSVEGYGPRAESCGDDPSEERWPQAAALSPGGTHVALVESGPGGVRLRVLRVEGEGSREVFQQELVDAPSITFAGSEADPTLLVVGRTLVALRRGADAPRPALANDEAEHDWLPTWSWRSDDGGAHVYARGLEPSEVSGDDDAWEPPLIRRLSGVAAEDVVERGLHTWRDARGRHVEWVVPACHEGVSNTDTYHRVSATDDGVTHVELVVDPGTSPAEVSALLAEHVDAHLGAPRERTLRELPERGCGI